TVGSYSGSLTFTTGDHGSNTSVPYISLLSNGIGIFSATLTTAGDQTLTVTDVSNPTLTGSSGTIAVSPSLATHFVISDSTSTAGMPLGFTVTALDRFNNTATGYSGTLDFSSDDPHADLPENSTLTNGVGTFSATLTTAGDQTITATDTTSRTLTAVSPQIVVAPAAASHLVV